MELSAQPGGKVKMDVYDVSIQLLVYCVWFCLLYISSSTGFPHHLKAEPSYETCLKLKWHNAKGSPSFLKVCIRPLAFYERPTLVTAFPN